MQENTSNATQQASEESKLDAVTSKYSDQFDRFSKSKSGNIVVDFLLFRRNIVPLTLSILFVLGVLVEWIIGIAGLIGKGPIGSWFSELVDKEVIVKGKAETISTLEVNYLSCFIVGIILIVVSPFVVHYVLELVRYLWIKVVVPLWEKVVIRFFVNVMPEIFPFLFERFMKFVDIMLDGLIAVIMIIVALVKGVIFIPKSLCQRFSKWVAKPLEGTSSKK